MTKYFFNYYLYIIPVHVQDTDCLSIFQLEPRSNKIYTIDRIWPILLRGIAQNVTYQRLYTVVTVPSHSQITTDILIL